MISLSLWLHLYYYMIYNKRFVSSVDEEPKTSNDQSGATNQKRKLDENIKGSNINEINTPEHSHSSEETKDATDPVYNQTSEDSTPGDSSVVTEHRITQPSSEQKPTQTPEETKDSSDPVSKQKSETSIPEVKLIELDIEKTESTTEFDYSKNNNVVTYTPKQGYGFSTVKIGKGWKVWSSDKVIWNKIYKSQYSNKVDIECGSDEQKTLTIHCVDGTTKVFKKVKDGDFLLTSEVKLVELDIKKTESTGEFDYSKNNNVVTYTPKQGYGFGTVKKSKPWWKCGSDKVIWNKIYKSQYSNKVVVETGSDKQKTLTIHCVDGTTKVFKKPKGGNYSIQYQQTSENTSDQIKLVELDIKKTESTGEFDYAKNNVVTYTPKQGYGFGTVKKSKPWWKCGSDKVIWEAYDGSKHSNKVVVQTGSDKQKTLTIHCVDGTTKVYKKVKGGNYSIQYQQTSESTSAEVELIDLDITKAETTGEFNYSSEGKVAVFKAKPGYGFSIVKKGKGSCSCTGSDEIIWEAEDKSNISNKVTACQVPQTIRSILFCVDIYMVDGSTLNYLKSSEAPYNKEWVQKSENVPKERHEPQIKIYTKDETASEAKENDTDKYTVDIVFKEKKTFEYIYYIKKEVKCTQVKYNNQEVWNNSQDKDHESIDRLIFDTRDKSIILKHKGIVIKEYKISDEPKQK